MRKFYKFLINKIKVIMKYNTDTLLPTIKDIIRQDIVSTSDESQSSSLENASKLTT